MLNIEDRRDILLMFEQDAVETIKGLEFYLKTLEVFIRNERSKGISDLERDADKLSKESQGEFWAWNYPVHWDEIFASQLRSSFLVTLVSLAESHLGMVAEQACETAGTPLKPSELRGGFFERHRKCLHSLAGFTRPDDRTWSAICEIRDVRNCIVHGNSRLSVVNNEQRLRSLLEKLPGLTASYSVLELAEEFPIYALQAVRQFVFDLYTEGKGLCRRSTASGRGI